MPLLAKTEADRKRLLLRELCERFGRHLHPRASGRTWTSIAQELSVGEGTVRRAAAAKNLLHIAPASALVPVLQPGRDLGPKLCPQLCLPPDLTKCYMASDATDSEMVKKAGFREIGSLKGNIGDQNYEIPANVDLAKYHAVTIWCQRFGVNFATAPLSSSRNSNSAPQVLSSGNFHDVAHKGAGQATVYQLADGKRVLRFTNFETSNGPDVHVYLVATKDASDSETVKHAGFVEVGALKGNIGDQNYELPSHVDLNKYRAVTIWCRRFGVNFATAPLNPASAPMSAMNQ